ncbi:MAG: CDP-alcohol phosphatidyltransferase family protein, partial [Waterburya sp.]
KLLVLGSLLALIELQLVPAWGVFLILTRELAIAGWRVNPQLTGNTSISGANIWGKLKTIVQIIAIACLIAPLPDQWNSITLILFWLAVVISLISGWIYILPSISSSKEKSISE